MSCSASRNDGARRRGIDAFRIQLELEHLPGQLKAEFETLDHRVADEFVLRLVAGIFQADDGLGELLGALLESIVAHGRDFSSYGHYAVQLAKNI